MTSHISPVRDAPVTPDLVGRSPTPSSRTEVVAEAIKQSILEGRLKPGQAVVERELAAELGVSKTPVREALRALLSTGLLTMSPYRGVTVRSVDNESIRCLYQLRGLLEPAAVALGVGRHSSGDLDGAAELLRQAARAGRSGDLTQLSQLNRDFHRLLYQSCGNPLLVSALDDLRDQVSLVAVAWWTGHPTWAAEETEHLAILQAVTAGDAELAELLTRRHVNGTCERLMAGQEHRRD